MKYFYIAIILVSIAQITSGMKTTFFIPTSQMQKPRFTLNNLTSLEAFVGHSKATKSYNKSGKTVPVLAYRGVEPLLPQFVDSTISAQTSTPVSYALFDSTFKSLNYGGSWTQNIGTNFYFETGSRLVQEKLTNITLRPTTIDGIMLTESEIEANAALSAYLPKLKEKLFTSSRVNAQSRNYAGPSYFLLGYTKSFTDFDTLDFFDFSVQSGLIIPATGNKPEEASFLIFPHENLVNLAIPLQISLAIGLFDWLNIGGSANITTYIKNDQIIALNSASAPNKLIIPQSGICSVYHQPQIQVSGYIEGEYFLPGWTWLVGTTYTKQHKTQYVAQDKEKFPLATINEFPSHHEWEIVSLTFSTEFDLSKSTSKFLPRCKIMYSRPIAGHSCFASSQIAGQLGLDVRYDF